MSSEAWKRRLERWRGGGPIEWDLRPFQSVVDEVGSRGEALEGQTDDELNALGRTLRDRAVAGAPNPELIVDVYALVREVARRQLGLRPFDVQVLAAVALEKGTLVEMATGEGKTLAAVLPAVLNALAGRGVHVLTFNDYLARRDARWMAPIYRFLGLSVEPVQAGMSIEQRRRAYEADVTYATAKEAGFDFLRMHLAREPQQVAQRPFNFALVDEADSILIDEARVPLVIAGDLATSETSRDRLVEVVAGLEEGAHWESDENERNVYLTEAGYDHVEATLSCGDLHAVQNYLLLTEIHQALHAQFLLHRDVDYIVRGERIELVDEFTGRVVPDRRWPDGLQAALEAKEGLPIQRGGQILGSIALQHFLRRYPKLAGMTATAQPAAEELEGFYGLKVVPVPPNRPCARDDQPDLIFTHGDAKAAALVEEIGGEHERGRPVLVGTSSVKESEELAARLSAAGIEHAVLNARNDEAEAEIIAGAGSIGAVTISTNMAGRGTDIRLGGVDEAERDEVLALGGLYVIGTNRHESRRIDDQLRGRSGRQGDPGTTRFFVSLEDHLMVRFGVDELIRPKWRPAPQAAPVDNPVIRRVVERLQRIVEGQNFEVRKTLWSYSLPIEEQRRDLQQWRTEIMLRETEPQICAERAPERHAALCDQHGVDVVTQLERAIVLHHIDRAWAEHLAFISQVREGVHLVAIGRLDPLQEFRKELAVAFRELHQTIEERTARTFSDATITADGIDLDEAGLRGPSATWTYLINDRAFDDLHQALLGGPGNYAFAAGAWLVTGPLLAAWGIWKRLRSRDEA